MCRRNGKMDKDIWHLLKNPSIPKLQYGTGTWWESLYARSTIMDWHWPGSLLVAWQDASDPGFQQNASFSGIFFFSRWTSPGLGISGFPGFLLHSQHPWLDLGPSFAAGNLEALKTPARFGGFQVPHNRARRLGPSESAKGLSRLLGFSIFFSDLIFRTNMLFQGRFFFLIWKKFKMFNFFSVLKWDERNLSLGFFCGMRIANISQL